MLYFCIYPIFMSVRMHCTEKYTDSMFVPIWVPILPKLTKVMFSALCMKAASLKYCSVNGPETVLDAFGAR